MTVRVINATEGGAKIKGTEIMTLKQAIKEVCVKKFATSYIWETINPILTEADKSSLLEYMHDTKYRLEKVKKKARTGINYYNKLLSISQKEQFDAKQYLDISRRIKKINEFLDKDFTAQFVMDNLQGIEYTFQATTFIMNGDDRDERIVAAKEGIYLLRCILFAADELIGRLGDSVEAYHGDDQVLYDRYDSSIANLVV